MPGGDIKKTHTAGNGSHDNWCHAGRPVNLGAELLNPGVSAGNDISSSTSLLSISSFLIVDPGRSQRNRAAAVTAVAGGGQAKINATSCEMDGLSNIEISLRQHEINMILRRRELLKNIRSLEVLYRGTSGAASEM